MSSNSTASPIVSKFSSVSQNAAHDEDLEHELRTREMKKIQDARARMMADAASAACCCRSATGYRSAICCCASASIARANAGYNGDTETEMTSSSHTNSRMNACDLTGEEFKIVCEELWIDFNSWVNHRSNIRDCIAKFRAMVVSKWLAVAPIIVFLVWFRWYMGAGKDACSYGLGYGVFSFVCEVLRHLGEIVAVVIMTFIGYCVGLAPILACICIYEFKDAFPDPDEAEAEDSDNDGHLKKE
jgi:hypothetical protein